MKFMGLGLQEALYLGGVLAGVLTLLYLLKLRRRRIEVPFSPLWSKVLMNREASNWLQRLKRLLSLLLQILILSIILLALADPQPEKEIERGRSIAVILDTSASMNAVEPGKNQTRFAIAREQVEDIVKNLGPHDRMTIIAMDGKVRSITGDFTDRKPVLNEALESLKPSATEANVIEALRTAADSVTDRLEPEILLLSDGAHGKHLAIPNGLIPSHVKFEHRIVANRPRFDEVIIPPETADGAEKTEGDATAEKTEGDATTEKTEGDATTEKTEGDATTEKTEGDATAEKTEGDAAEESPVVVEPRVELVINNPEELAGNISISGFNIRRYLSNKLDYEIYIQAQNHFAEPVCVELSLYNLVPNDKTIRGEDGAPDTVEREWLEKQIPLRDQNETRNVEEELLDNPCRPSNDDLTIAFELPPSGKEQRFYPRKPMASDYVMAKINLTRRVDAKAKAHAKYVDALPIDNKAFVLIPKFKKAKVLLVTPGNLFVEAALLFNQENYEVAFLTPEEATPGQIRQGKFDLVIFDNSEWDEGIDPVAPALPGPGNYMYINPRGDKSPFEIVRSTNEEVFVERINRKHPMSRWLVMRDLNIARGTVLKTRADVRVDGSRDQTLVKAVYGPLVITHRTRDTRLVGVGFSITESDIVLRIALPVLIINAVDWFLDDAGSLIKAYRTGESWHIPVPPGLSSVNVKGPAGTLDPDIPTHEGEVVYYGADSGFYELTPGNDSGVSPESTRWEVAANFVSSKESDLIPMAEPLPSQEPARQKEIALKKEAEIDQLGEWSWIFKYLDRYDLWLYCVFAVLGLLVFEWMTFHRRYTV